MPGRVGFPARRHALRGQRGVAAAWRQPSALQVHVSGMAETVDIVHRLGGMAEQLNGLIAQMRQDDGGQRRRGGRALN